LDGLWWGENPAAGVFRKDQFLQPTMGFAISLPEGWKHQHSPRYVIASHPSKEAILVVGAAGPASDPEAQGRRFIDRMRAKARLEPASASKTSVGEFPAFVVTYLDKSSRMVTYLHFAWVAMGGKTYQLVGLVPETQREALRKSVLTLRPLTDAERLS